MSEVAATGGSSVQLLMPMTGCKRVEGGQHELTALEQGACMIQVHSNPDCSAAIRYLARAPCTCDQGSLLLGHEPMAATGASASQRNPDASESALQQE
jgi:hypothetical protein